MGRHREMFLPKLLGLTRHVLNSTRAISHMARWGCISAAKMWILMLRSTSLLQTPLPCRWGASPEICSSLSVERTAEDVASNMQLIAFFARR